MKKNDRIPMNNNMKWRRMETTTWTGQDIKKDLDWLMQNIYKQFIVLHKNPPDLGFCLSLHSQPAP